MQRALQNRKADTTVTARYVGCYIEPIPKLFEGYEIYGTLSETMTYQFNNLRGASMGEGGKYFFCHLCSHPPTAAPRIPCEVAGVVYQQSRVSVEVLSGGQSAYSAGHIPRLLSEQNEILCWTVLPISTNFLCPLHCYGYLYPAVHYTAGRMHCFHCAHSPMPALHQR